MRTIPAVLAASFLALTLAACGGKQMSVTPPTMQTGTRSSEGQLSQIPQTGEIEGNLLHLCAAARGPGMMRCDSLMRIDLMPDITPAGYSPASLQSAYKLPSATRGTAQTVALVDAFNDPTAEADLGVYRTQFHLGACTTADKCFRKVNQSGVAGSYPPTNAGWAAEISLDLDMVSAICPKCHIILVEANDNSFTNLAAGENEAVKLGANVVSNSFGGAETAASNSAFNHPGHVVTASAGDDGTGPQQPCSFGTVICVGGTHLIKATNTRGWSETAWTGTGSGCSAFVAKPTFQTDKSCTRRSESDTSADADPNTGVAVYDTTPVNGERGWLVFGGTSASAPMIAAVYALAGNAATVNYARSIWVHGGTSAFFDVISGSNGSCSITYICHAAKGYDGPTGWGTPNSTTAF